MMDSSTAVKTGGGGEAPLISLANAGKIDPSSIAEYVEAGGFEALKRALAMEPKEVFQEVTDSGLQGRGGAGFPTGLKEKLTGEALCEACGPKYLVCNADEGEPGTFKDRAVMENDPHKMIEGMCISAYAIGAEKAFIYIRGEYTESILRVRRAVDNCYREGYLGEKILDSNFSLDVEIRLGAGSYLCGEELTLLESIEGKRGYPRVKPPYPAEHGLFGAPTLVNNVETFAQVPFVVENGADAYKSFGIEGSPGTKIFSVSGDIEHPRYFESPMGVTLREIIEEYCGGMRGDARFYAALLGGAAGTFVDDSFLDVPMGYESLKKRGASLGSGAVIVLKEGRRITDTLLSIMEFFRHESCGKCIPCRVGTDYLVLVMRRIIEETEAGGKRRRELFEELQREAEYMDKSSLCPLGKSPILSIRSAGRFFADKEL